MAKQDMEPTEYSWDTGTYQTGASKPNKNQSAVITALLVSTIFLGGIASALGIMNIRLLSQLLDQQQEAVLPLSVDGTAGSANSFLRENPDSAPEVPENGKLELVIENIVPAGVLTPAQIVQKNQTSMVNILVETSRGQQQSGPCLVLSDDGYLLTNAHLTENAEEISVELPDGTRLPAALVGSDVYCDLSVLYVQTKDLTAAAFAPSQQHTPGENVYDQAGNAGQIQPGGQVLSVGGQSIGLVVTDLGGNAGAVFNEFGQVTGFLCRFMGDDEAPGLMIPGNLMVDIAAQIVEKGAVSGRPSLGLQVREISSFCRQYWNLSSGLEVTALESGSGLLEGDILLTLDGAALTTQTQLYDALRSAQIGSSVTLEVFRAGQRLTLTLPVTQTP